jgi:hypothetical protein
LSDNLHVNTAEEVTEPWLQPTAISFETVKVEDLNRMIIASQPFVTVATTSSTKGLKWLRINGFNSLKMLTAILSDGYLSKGILK